MSPLNWTVSMVTPPAPNTPPSDKTVRSGEWFNPKTANNKKEKKQIEDYHSEATLFFM